MHIPNVNIIEPNKEGPMALKTSVFLENEDGTVQGNRLLVVSINEKNWSSTVKTTRTPPRPPLSPLLSPV